MVGKLLLRGMLVGLIAGLLGFIFLKAAGEPSVDRAIAFESALDASKAQAAAASAKAEGMATPMAEPDEDLVSRPVQAGLGLFTGVVVYCVAFGGLFALVFAVSYGRLGVVGPRGTAALLAVLGFVAVYLVPILKYPANPPSVGEPGTIGMRTAFFFAMIALSLAGMIAAAMVRGRLARRFGGWNAAIMAGAAYVVAMAVVAAWLPAVNEVPDQFPAVVLWQFRLASLGAQAMMWTVLGLAFGAFAERLMALPGARIGQRATA